jgi:hypothetical protein
MTAAALCCTAELSAGLESCGGGSEELLVLDTAVAVAALHAMHLQLVRC